MTPTDRTNISMPNDNSARRKERTMEKSHAHIDPMHPTTTGDTAVSGLFHGLLAGAAMAAVIVLFSLASGSGLGYLGYFSSGPAVAPLQGLVGHLAVSAIYGMLYALLRRWIGPRRLEPLPGWLAGLIYALLLWAFAIGVLLPAANSPFLSLSWVVFLSGHIAYGLALGWSHKP